MSQPVDILKELERSMIFSKKVLNLEELCRYTGFEVSYIYKLTAKRVIPYSKPNGKTMFFDREKIDQWLLSNPITTTDELEAKASTYITKTK